MSNFKTQLANQRVSTAKYCPNAAPMLEFVFLYLQFLIKSTWKLR